MKKIGQFILAISSLLVCSCNADLEIVETDDTPNSEIIPNDESNAIQAYYTKCAELIDKFLDYENENGNGELFNISLPEIGILNELDIELADGGTTRFSELPIEDQHIFIHEAMKHMALMQKQKYEIVGMAELNRRFERMAEFIDYTSSITSEYIRSGKSVCDIIAAVWSKFGEPSWYNFTTGLEYWINYITPTKGIIGSYSNPRTFTWDEFIERVGGVANKGDLFIVLPVYNNLQALFNVSGRSLIHHNLGHCAICIDDYTPETPEDKEILMGAILEGVSIEPSSIWLFEFYILEIQRFHYIWTGNTATPLIITSTPVTEEEERNEFVEFGKQYLGAPFVEGNISDYIVTKKLVPNNFTCAAFVWYCAKNVYGIDLSIPELPTVAPAHIVCSPHIRIKKFVQ